MPRVDGAASSPGAPSSLEAVPGMVKTPDYHRDGEPKPFSHQPTSFLGWPPAPPCSLSPGPGSELRGAILTSFWRHRTAGAAGPACAASVHVSLLQRDQVGGPGYSRGRVLEAPDVL